jgi:hypothetical protein
VKRDALWTMVGLGLIVLVIIIMVAQYGMSNLVDLSATAERWDFLMRRLSQ